MDFKKKSMPFESVDYKREVYHELAGGKEINALLLVHGYLEAYLREWLLICGKGKKQEFSKKVIEIIDKYGFFRLAVTHLMLNNFDISIFKKLENINRIRNNFAHELIKIDFNDEKTKRKIKKQVQYAIFVCDEIFKLYTATLDKRQVEFAA